MARDRPVPPRGAGRQRRRGSADRRRRPARSVSARRRLRLAVRGGRDGVRAGPRRTLQVPDRRRPSDVVPGPEPLLRAAADPPRWRGRAGRQGLHAPCALVRSVRRPQRRHQVHRDPGAGRARSSAPPRRAPNSMEGARRRSRRIRSGVRPRDAGRRPRFSALFPGLQVRDDAHAGRTRPGLRRHVARLHFPHVEPVRLLRPVPHDPRRHRPRPCVHQEAPLGDRSRRVRRGVLRPDRPRGGQVHAVRVPAVAGAGDLLRLDRLPGAHPPEHQVARAGHGPLDPRPRRPGRGGPRRARRRALLDRPHDELDGEGGRAERRSARNKA